jgi:hypothetical protein
MFLEGIYSETTCDAMKSSKAGNIFKAKAISNKTEPRGARDENILLAELVVPGISRSSFCFLDGSGRQQPSRLGEQVRSADLPALLRPPEPVLHNLVRRRLMPWRHHLVYDGATGAEGLSGPTIESRAVWCRGFCRFRDVRSCINRPDLCWRGRDQKGRCDLPMSQPRPKAITAVV